MLTHVLAAIFFLISFFFVHRSFYGMRIGSGDQPPTLSSRVRTGCEHSGPRVAPNGVVHSGRPLRVAEGRLLRSATPLKEGNYATRLLL